MKTKENLVTPVVVNFVAAVCTAFGVVRLLVGLLMLGVALANIKSTAPDALGFVQSGLGITVGAFLWFALGCGVALLGQIAQNTAARA